MQIPMLIEPAPGGGFQAKVGEPFNLSANGPTESEASTRLMDLVNGLLARGRKIVALTIADGKASVEEQPLSSGEGYKFRTF
jgi:hypothetical protein